MIKMESLQDCNQQTWATQETSIMSKTHQIAGFIRMKLIGNSDEISLHSQFLLRLRRLQDVDKVLQVVEILRPGQAATHGAHHLHRRRYHALVLQHVPTTRKMRRRRRKRRVSAKNLERERKIKRHLWNPCELIHLEHLLVQQRCHGIRHDVVLQGARRHGNVAVGQLLGQFPESTASTVDLKRRHEYEVSKLAEQSKDIFTSLIGRVGWVRWYRIGFLQMIKYFFKRLKINQFVRMIYCEYYYQKTAISHWHIRWMKPK